MNHSTLLSRRTGETTGPNPYDHPGRSEESPRNDWKLIGACLLFLFLISVLLLTAPSPSANAADVLSWPPVSADPSDISSPVTLDDTENVFTLTILHTNDTWGYLDPCG
jgi:hypothetical protein